MSTVITSFVTLSCDNEGCDKNITFPQTPEGEQDALRDHVWMQSLRFVQTPDGRKFTYCSDECEIKATGNGTHNKPIIVPAGKQSDVNLAAQAAERARQATEAIKAGGKVTL